MICYSESFQISCLAQTMRPTVLYNQAKIGKILIAILEKRTKNLKNGHLITYNPGLNYFSKKESSSDYAPYCALQPCKRLEKSLEPI